MDNFDALEDSFCEHWNAAKDLFQKKILLAGGEYYEIPTGQLGPNQEKLVISIGIVSFKNGRIVSPSDELFKNLILHFSGVHGVEGFAGCAAQSNWLDSLIRQNRQQIGSFSSDHSVVIFHGVNPWGMSWLRRVNARNIDLNRNVIEWHSATPSSDLYSSINPILTAKGWKRAFWLTRLAWVACRMGAPYVTQAFTGGQYIEPRGFYYGGTEWEPEVLAVKEFLETKFKTTSRVFAIDVHTGLGPYGGESLFTHHSATAQDVELISSRLGLKITHNEVSGKATYHAAGEFSTVIFNSFKNAQVQFVLQEFGTYSNLRVLRGFYKEHHGWLSGKFGPGVESSEALKKIFYPDDRSWRSLILKKSHELITLVQRRAFQ